MQRLLILIAALLLMAVAMPVAAQFDWECYFDFRVADHGFTPSAFYGSTRAITRVAGQGWLSGYNNRFVGAVISKTNFRSGADITLRELEINQTTVRPIAISGGDIHWVIMDGADNLWSQNIGTVAPATITSSGTSSGWTGNTINIAIWAEDSQGDVGSVVIHDLRMSGIGTAPDDCPAVDDPPPEEEGLTRPLQPLDRLFAVQSIQEGTIEGTIRLANEAVIFGAKKDAKVSAVIDGTVTQIEDLTPARCYELFDPAVAANLLDATAAYDNCRVTLVADFFSAGDYVNMFSPINNPPPAYVIHIEGTDGREYLQIATHVDDYVYEGQTVMAGCWLGLALSIPSVSAGTVGTVVSLYLPITGALIQVFGQDSQPFEALTAVWVIDTVYIDASEEYILDPSDSAPCNTPEGYEGCMGDSRLEDPSAWQSSNSVSWTDPGAMMAPGSFIAATFNLNLERDPVVLVGAVAAPMAVLEVQLGDNIEPINYVLGTTEIEVAAGDPDEGSFFTVRLENVGSEPARISFICILHDRDPAGDITQRPDIPNTKVCQVIDASFDAGLTEWTKTGTATADDGSILMATAATLNQPLTLKAGNYTLSIVTELWTISTYVHSDTNVTGGITMNYAWPATTDVSMGTKTYASYAQHKTQTFTATIVVASDETGSIRLKPTIASAPTGLSGVRISSACLTKAGTVPGGDGDGLITPTCGAIPSPSLANTSFGTWTSWLWAQLNKFYRCELIKVLNQMLTVMTNFFRTALWSIRWNQAAAIRTGNFISSGFYWLNGHLHNIAVGRVYYVEGSEFESYGDIGDVLLGGLSSVIEAFVDLLQRLIDFFFYMLSLVFQVALSLIVALVRLGIILIGLIIGAIGQFFDLINALFFAWNNSTASPIAGLPMCAVEPKEAPVCIFLWTLENTIFSGRGFLFIPFMIAYGSAELLLWAIAKFSRRTQETGQSG